jgi:glycosyltransferase involved in cell wall biosynthesis
MAAERTDAFISVAQAMTEKCLAEGIGRPGQFTKVFSGMAVGDFLNGPSAEEIGVVRRKLGIASDAVVIATVGRLFELKGHEYVIESAKHLAGQANNVVWLFIGGGVWRGKIEKQIAAAGLSERFRLTGLVRPEEIAKLLHSSDLLVHPSLREGLARAIPQAMLCGRPVVSFDIDGACEVVIDGETGFLVAAGDVGGLVEAQGKLVRDAGLRRRMGEAGREFCGREFDCELMVDRIERVYHNLMA